MSSPAAHATPPPPNETKEGGGAQQPSLPPGHWRVWVTDGKGGPKPSPSRPVPPRRPRPAAKNGVPLSGKQTTCANGKQPASRERACVGRGRPGTDAVAPLADRRVRGGRCTPRVRASRPHCTPPHRTTRPTPTARRSRNDARGRARAEARRRPRTLGRPMAPTPPLLPTHARARARRPRRAQPENPTPRPTSTFPPPHPSPSLATHTRAHAPSRRRPPALGGNSGLAGERGVCWEALHQGGFGKTEGDGGTNRGEREAARAGVSVWGGEWRGGGGGGDDRPTRVGPVMAVLPQGRGPRGPHGRKVAAQAGCLRNAPHRPAGVTAPGHRRRRPAAHAFPDSHEGLCPFRTEVRDPRPLLPSTPTAPARRIRLVAVPRHRCGSKRGYSAGI